MGETTHISWADHTFNPWIGCMKVSPACDGCYAENLMATRYGRVTWGAPGQGVGTRERTSKANWGKPLTWDRKAKANGTRPFVFCASLADVFDNAVPAEWRRDPAKPGEVRRLQRGWTKRAPLAFVRPSFRRSLSPPFVGDLMGWPPGLTSFACSEMASSIWKGRMRSALLRLTLHAAPPEQLNLFG